MGRETNVKKEQVEVEEDGEIYRWGKGGRLGERQTLTKYIKQMLAETCNCQQFHTDADN